MNDKNLDFEKSVEKWENGELGRSEDFVKTVTIPEEVINNAIGLQLISIRLQKGLIEDLKLIAQLNGIGYQPLIKQILTRFVNAEKKQILKDTVDELIAEQLSKGLPLKDDNELINQPKIKKYG